MSIGIFAEIVVILINVIGAVLGFWVWNTSRKELSNRWFGIMTGFMLLWVDFAYLANGATTTSWATLWYRLNMAAVALFLLSFYRFYVLYFLREKGRNVFFERSIWIGAVVLAFLSIFTGLIIEGAVIQEWGADAALGPASLAFDIFALLVVAIILYFSFVHYRSFLPQEKLKFQYFLVGIIIFIVMNVIFNVASPVFLQTARYQSFGDYSAIFFLGFTAYAIVKRNLFGMRVVLTTLLVVLIAVLLFINATVLTQDLLAQIIQWVILGVFIFFGFLLIRSITREIKLREQLQEANAKLTKLDQAKSDFISIASHQLRTPLSAIKGYLSMVVDGDYGMVADNVGKVLTRVYNSNERLIALVNNMLNISRIESGRIQFHPQPLQLEMVINDVIGEIGPEARARQIQLIFRPLLRPSKKVQADDKIVHEVLNNLVDNAIKYTPHGTVTISLHPKPQVLEIHVKDTGIGIAADDIPRLFKKFSRGQDVYKDYATGSGLGLYVVKQLVEMHGGQVGVESAGAGKGSTFWFTMPYAII